MCICMTSWKRIHMTSFNNMIAKSYMGCFFNHFYEFLLSFTVRFMKLENLLEDMKHPCVLDIKMGRKTYDPFASKEKIAMETAKFPPAKNIGYQISGMLVEIFVFILISKSIRISNIFLHSFIKNGVFY